MQLNAGVTHSSARSGAHGCGGCVRTARFSNASSAAPRRQLPRCLGPRDDQERALEQAFRLREDETRSPTHSQLADDWLQALKAPSHLQQPKVFVFVRHGHSTWNEQSRIQGNTDESELTDIGRSQAVLAREALRSIQFDSCFSSPHTRARQTTDIVWQPYAQGAAQAEPLFLPSLAEVDLGWFQGLRNEDIARDHPDLYQIWREEPERFMLAGRYPVLDAFRQARHAWHDMLASPGRVHLVVTHKSLLRAMLCTALGLPPRQFRAIDISNAAVCMCRSSARGDMMLSALNLTSHLLHPSVRYTLPAMPKNDALASESGSSGSGSSGGSGGSSSGGSASAPGAGSEAGSVAANAANATQS